MESDHVHFLLQLVLKYSITKIVTIITMITLADWNKVKNPVVTMMNSSTNFTPAFMPFVSSQSPIRNIRNVKPKSRAILPCGASINTRVR